MVNIVIRREIKNETNIQKAVLDLWKVLSVAGMVTKTWDLFLFFIFL